MALNTKNIINKALREQEGNNHNRISREARVCEKAKPSDVGGLSEVEPMSDTQQISKQMSDGGERPTSSSCPKCHQIHKDRNELKVYWQRIDEHLEELHAEIERLKKLIDEVAEARTAKVRL